MSEFTNSTRSIHLWVQKRNSMDESMRRAGKTMYFSGMATLLCIGVQLIAICYFLSQ